MPLGLIRIEQIQQTVVVFFSLVLKTLPVAVGSFSCARVRLCNVWLRMHRIAVHTIAGSLSRARVSSHSPNRAKDIVPDRWLLGAALACPRPQPCTVSHYAICAYKATECMMNPATFCRCFYAPLSAALHARARVHGKMHETERDREREIERGRRLR